MVALWYPHCEVNAKLKNRSSIHIEIESDDSPFMEQTANKIIEMVGEPRNYGVFNCDCVLCVVQWYSGV